eukprot:TRINITY_DN5205_c0_g1_i1.p1 TRINITY_DN5205_c0_g1~~TRINITY_DN5205_c0_g1_i1.p1  ORF type:complete len:145 (+),score=29.19 TRINITY_DN5205_c0_g1_i1:235-669(+)
MACCRRTPSGLESKILKQVENKCREIQRVFANTTSLAVVSDGGELIYEFNPETDSEELLAAISRLKKAASDFGELLDDPDDDSKGILLHISGEKWLFSCYQCGDYNMVFFSDLPPAQFDTCDADEKVQAICEELSHLLNGNILA